MIMYSMSCRGKVRNSDVLELKNAPLLLLLNKMKMIKTLHKYC